jgi:hypothetical protein
VKLAFYGEEMPMNRFAIAALLFLATNAWAQSPIQAPAPKPTVEELAFARLPADIQQMLSGMTPAQAMQTIAQAGQQSIATGNPRPTQEQFRTTLGAVLGSSYSGYVSASAGATSFPPLSPLVAPPPPPFLR